MCFFISLFYTLMFQKEQGKEGLKTDDIYQSNSLILKDLFRNFILNINSMNHFLLVPRSCGKV